MINPRIRLLLDPQFIRFSADSYQWALDAAREYHSLSESKQKEINAYRRGVRYVDTAVELINVEFKDVVVADRLGAVTESDARRSWLIVHRARPEDPLGLAYTWFITRISLYVPDRMGRVHRPIPTTLGRSEVVDHLFRQFLTWAEKNNYLGSLSPTPEHPAFIDEIEGLFTTTIDVLTASNPYVKQIFKDNDLADTLITSTHAKERRDPPEEDTFAQTSVN